MKIGLIARADKTGLGIQTKAFYDHMSPDRTLVVDLRHCSGQSPDLSLYPDAKVWHDRRYPGTEIIADPVIDQFLDGLDLVFTCETPYNYYLFQKARELGVRTVQQYNFEFLDYLHFSGLPFPDLLAAPSPWNIPVVKRKLPSVRVELLPVPVDRKLLPFQQRSSLNKLLHIAGTPAVEDRNGTLLAIEAMKYVESPVTLTVKTQKRIPANPPQNVHIDNSDVENYWDLYGDEDAFLFPRKFGGLSLPINESISCGMVPILSGCEPQTAWIPTECLVRGSVTKQIMTKTMIDIYEVSPHSLAMKIDEFYEDRLSFNKLSFKMNEIGDSISWDTLKPRYISVFEGLLS